MKKKLLFILILAFGLTSCDLLKVGDSGTDKEPELPPITTTGENTFGAIVNGDIWLPSSSIRQGAVFQTTELITIFADKEIGDIDQNFSITIRNESITEGRFEFNSSNKEENRFVEWQDDKSGCFYKAEDDSSQYTGSLDVIKLDKTNKIISGTFEFVLSKVGCPMLEIEKGRFDLKYIN